MSGKDLTWELVHDEQIIKDRWIDMKAATYRLPDGREVGPFYHYSRQDFVVIIATCENGDLICVRQFRQGICRITTEFPAGGIEPGESPIDAARRELAEETGYTCGEMKLLMSVPASPTISSNMSHIVLAKDCRPAGEQSPDPYEFIEICRVPEERLEALIEEGEFPQPGHIMAWLLWKNLRKKG